MLIIEYLLYTCHTVICIIPFLCRSIKESITSCFWVRLCRIKRASGAITRLQSFKLSSFFNFNNKVILYQSNGYCTCAIFWTTKDVFNADPPAAVAACPSPIDKCEYICKYTVLIACELFKVNYRL